MRLFRTSIFWILVYLGLALGSVQAQAATTQSTNKPTLTPPLKEPGPSETSDKMDRTSSTELIYPAGTELQDSQIQNFAKKIPDTIHKEPNFGLQLGYLTGSTVTSSTTTQPFSLGGLFFLDEKNQVKYYFTQFEFNIQTDQTANISIAKRWPWLKYEDKMQPYFIGGVVNYMDANAGLAGVINLGHMKIRAGLGLSDLMNAHQRYYTEMAIGWGLAGMVIDLKIGQTFSF